MIPLVPGAENVVSRQALVHERVDPEGQAERTSPPAASALPVRVQIAEEYIRQRQTNVPGHIYLLHFTQPVGHALHYIGWAADGGLFKRLAQHESGNGRATPLIRALIASGGRFRLARVWDGDRNMERRLKNRRKAKMLCPICRGEAPWES